MPSHAGTHPSITVAVADALRTLRQQHPRWSYQLVHDNLVALAREKPELSPLPGYATVCRYMKDNGLGKRRKPRRHEQRPDFVPRERRSFEVTHVHGLWHCDFHDAKRKVMTASGEYQTATLFAMLDDRSRLCCHAQWYLGDEDTESFVHGLCQGFQKRGLPRALLSDNGAPMIAAETREGLARLSIDHHTTLSQTPEQNGKQEVFWAQVEGRLMAMLEGEPELTLELLNRATQAWVEHEYHRICTTRSSRRQLERWLAGPSVGRPCPSTDELRRAFRMELTRKQRTERRHHHRRGRPLRGPLRLPHAPAAHRPRRALGPVQRRPRRPAPRHPPRHALPRRQGEERRPSTPRARRRQPLAPPPGAPRPSGIAPLLRELMAEYAATGLPPAYLPHDPTAGRDAQGSDDAHSSEPDDHQEND